MSTLTTTPSAPVPALPSTTEEIPAAELSTSTAFTPPPLPAPFGNTTAPIKLIAHGAEALLYKTIFLTPNRPCILKHRPSKSWRHPTLDARLTRHRILSEARILVRCRRDNVPVPAVLALDSDAGWLCTEFVASSYGTEGRGLTVREGLERWRKEKYSASMASSEQFWEPVRDLLRRIGQAVARLHAIGVVHGDLTSSNLMLQSTDLLHDGSASSQLKDISVSGEVILIDFGLASTSIHDEDRAVDLYVLERAMGSTHPWLEEEFGLMLDGYKGSYKGASIALKRLEDVRMRGRKKSMIG